MSANNDSFVSVTVNQGRKCFLSTVVQCLSIVIVVNVCSGHLDAHFVASFQIVLACSHVNGLVLAE